MRTISSAAYANLLIWSVETFPTIFRVMGVSFVMIGGGVANIVAYVLKGQTDIQIYLCLVITFLALPISLKN
jgi:hypothetical protein